ncbi:MAG TPA: hypothetical protein VGF86_00840 [Candidatus Tumulicola sp.]
MSNSRRWIFLWVVASLLSTGCSGSAGVIPVPQPSGSAGPPNALGRGTLAVISHKGPHQFVLIFPPNGDKFIRQIPIRDEHGQHLVGNSLAFDRRGHLYIGMHDTSPGGKYLILEVDLQSGAVVRFVVVPGWSDSSVATDDENYLYVNTKATVGGDVEIFRNDRETHPYLRIKDHHIPVRIVVDRHGLWVGYFGLFAAVLARYRLRSTDRTLFQPIATNRIDALMLNPEGSLAAVLTKRENAKDVVDAIDVKSGKSVRKLAEAAHLTAMTRDESGDVFIGEQRINGGEWTIAVTNFSKAFYGRYASIGAPQALATSPLDGTLYVASRATSGIRVYNSKNGKLLKELSAGDDPSALAFEP